MAPLVLPFSATRDTLAAITASDEAHAPLAQRRRDAFARFERLGRSFVLPYRRPLWVAGERIMRTTPLAASAGQPGLTNDGRPNDELATLALANAGGLVHFGGLAIRPGGTPTLPAGVTIATLPDALTRHAALFETFFARRVDRAKGRDANLTGAFMNCGAFISIADGVRLAEPLQLLWVYPAGQTHTVFPFIAVSVGIGAEVTILERHHGEGDAFVCGMVDAHIAERGVLNYVVLQQLNDASHIRMARSGVMEKRATLAWQTADLGAAKVRNVTTLRAQGIASAGRSSALSFRSGKQRIDSTLHTDIRAAGAHTESVTNIVLANTSVARHHERITVRGRSRRANANSRCDGLLLSRKAALEFMPERNAAHDGISVSQRARVGSIDADTMFYLATRGIDHLSAMKMVALGFFEPAILAFPGETIRDEVRTALDERIEDAVN